MQRLSALSLTVLIVGTFSCGGDDLEPTGPAGPDGPTTGAIHVSLAMSGSDLDSDCCTVTVDGEAEQTVTNGATEAFSHLATGTHEVTISDVAANCQVEGSASRVVSVTGGETVSLTFDVNCDWRTRIAFASERDCAWYDEFAKWLCSSDIYVMNPDGSGQVPLTGDPDDLHYYYDPSWSPDGTQIAFYCGDICIQDVDGTERTPLTHGGMTPAWSPDGSRIAFSGEHRELYLIDSNGSNQTQLTTLYPTGTAVNPTWSPDGSRIAFEALLDGVDVYAVNVDGSGLVNLTDDPRYRDRSPAWSPDGSRIAFSRDGRIYLMDPDGSNLLPLTETGFNAKSPTWSPDGARIAYRSRQEGDGSYEVYVMNSDGSNPVNLTRDSYADYDPSWSPDLY